MLLFDYLLVKQQNYLGHVNTYRMRSGYRLVNCQAIDASPRAPEVLPDAPPEPLCCVVDPLLRVWKGLCARARLPSVRPLIPPVVSEVDVCAWQREIWTTRPLIKQVSLYANDSTHSIPL